MDVVSALPPVKSVVVAVAILVGGAFVAAVLRRAIAARLAGRPAAGAVLAPLREGALLLRQGIAITERPDGMLWVLAPALYAATAAAALTVVPLDRGVAIADVGPGIVLFGAAEALAIVAVFLHGWAPNSALSLLGAYRFVAVALSYELISMFVLIAAALPAQSLQVSAIVHAQADGWLVLRQPLGLAGWIVVTWGVTLSGPLRLPDGDDLAGGTSLEVSGRPRLAWKLARGGMLTVMCGMAAAVFLGGWHGPWLPGWVWMGPKTLAVMVVVIALGQLLARWPAERAVTALWTVGLPLSFVNLAIAGIEALP